MNSILFVGEHNVTTYEVNWHTHECWELVYCTGGSGTFILKDGTELSYREGDLVVLPSRLVHRNSSDEGFTNIHITVENPTFPNKSIFKISDDAEQHLRTVFMHARYYFTSDFLRKEYVLHALGELVISYIVMFQSNESLSEPVAYIRSEIVKNHNQASFSLEQTMHSMPFQYNYLRKRFKKEIGKTPLEYLTQMRMREAENILLGYMGHEYSIAEVAGMCGYEDALYFSRVFKKYFGCSPSAYVKQSAAKKSESGNDVPRTFMNEPAQQEQ
ncbi:MAG: AraC family transcriptional regulator [Eubacteriales bacterium]|nr:AraC family transcriptional regulator [Eubacteriales bacterium]